MCCRNSTKDKGNFGRRLGGRQGEIGSRIPLDEAPLAFRELLIVGSSLQGLGRCGPYGCQEYLRAKFLI